MDKKTKFLEMIREICQAYGHKDFIPNLLEDMKNQRVFTGHKASDNNSIFKWMIGALSYQGVSNQVASGYQEEHGDISYLQISRALNQSNSRCGKLKTFESFTGCGYLKSRRTCNNQYFFKTCPLPKHDLRKGPLNQMAYSFYFFLRDVCQRDLVGYLKKIAAEYSQGSKPDEIIIARDKIVKDLSRVYGTGPKTMSMCLSELLVAIGFTFELDHLKAIGYSLIAIDSLVHNFLHRSGIIHAWGQGHRYAANSCYVQSRCSSVIEVIAREIDCRAFNPEFPAYFPRYIQKAIWRFCSQENFDICNGNTINDRERCQNDQCPVYRSCERRVLDR